MIAARRGRFSMFEYLLDKGADFNAQEYVNEQPQHRSFVRRTDMTLQRGRNVLHIACSYDIELNFAKAMEIVATLLKYGAGAMMSTTNQA